MANWNLPQLADLKVDVLDMLKQRDVDAITLSEGSTNQVIGAIKWVRQQDRFQTWSGTAWVDMVISIAGGGTGAQDINGFLDNFNLGSMALQDSNNVTITGGKITGLSQLHTAGNLTVDGVIYAGSGTVPLTNSSGTIKETSIDNIANIAHINVAEVITGFYNFNNAVMVTGNASLPATAAGISIAGGYATPTAGRIIFGDGTGWSMFFSSRAGGVTTDRFTFTDYGAFTANGDIIGGGNLATVGSVRGGTYVMSGTGHYKQSDGASGLYMGGANIQMFSDDFQWRNKTDTQVTMRLTPYKLTVPAIDITNSLNVGGAITSNGLLSTNYTDIQILGSTHARFMMFDKSQPVGSRAFLAINTAQNLYITASDDTGAPVYGVWDRAINITRDGGVGIGMGGLYVQRIINGTGLAAATYTPTGWGVVRVSGLTYYPTNYSRVGNIVTVSGKVDVTNSSVGQSWFVISLPWPGSQAQGTVTSLTPLESGAINISSQTGGGEYVDCIFECKAPSIHSVYFCFQYLVR